MLFEEFTISRIKPSLINICKTSKEGYVMVSICDLIKRAKNFDKESMELLLSKFDPILSSLSRKLQNEDAKSELTIFFIRMIYEIKLTNLMNSSDGALVNYIKQGLYREYYKLNKVAPIISVEFNDIFTIDTNDYVQIEYKVFLDELVMKKVINERQKYVLLKRYFYHCTDEEISIELCISRQAVNKIHRKAIDNLKKYLN